MSDNLRLDGVLVIAKAVLAENPELDPDGLARLIAPQLGLGIRDVKSMVLPLFAAQATNGHVAAPALAPTPRVAVVAPVVRIAPPAPTDGPRYRVAPYNKQLWAVIDSYADPTQVTDAGYHADVAWLCGDARLAYAIAERLGDDPDKPFLQAVRDASAWHWDHFLRRSA